MNEANMKVMQTQINNVKNELRNEIKNSIQASMSNQTNELKNMMASFFQMKTASTSGSGSLPSNTIANSKGELKSITTRSGIVLDGPSVPIPLPFINSDEDERIEETLTDQDLAEDPLHLNITYPSRMLKQKQQEKDEVQIHNFWQMFKQLHLNITLADALILMPKYQKMLKALLSNKEKLQELENTPLNENCSPVILKKLPEKLRDPGKFLIPCAFNELKCKALVDLGDSINLMPLFVWNKLEEMILRDGDERLTLNMRHDTLSYSNQPQNESINLINVFNDSSKVFLENLFSTNQPSGNLTFPSHPILTSPEVKDDIFDPEGGNVLPEKLLDLDFTKDLHPLLHVNSLSGSTTYSSSPNQLLEEFADKLALITFPPENDDLHFDIESDLKEIEYPLHHDPIKDIDSILKDLIDQSNLADLNDNLVDSIHEMFTNEHALDYSSPPLYDEYDDDIFEVESDTENVYDDPFDSKEEKIKSILIQENLFEIITRVAQDKKLAISHASLMIEDFDRPFYELPFFKEVPRYSWNLKTHAKGFFPPVFISSASIKESSSLGLRSGEAFVLLRIHCEVMTAPVIPNSSYSYVESVGSHVPLVILFGTIPTSILVIPVVPDKVSIAPVVPLVALERIFLLVAPELALVSPFLCFDDSEADCESEPVEQRPERHESLTDHDVMVSRGRQCSN
nr:hypothetical protein [Tanacetum cinerariifolium]